MLTQLDISDLEKAGSIAKNTIDKLIKTVKAGMGIGELYDLAVQLITEEGADLAFPPNISLDAVAAHDSASIDDKRRIPENAVIKIDLGANINGMLSDTAKTICVGKKYPKLVKAAEEALKGAIEIIKPGIWPGDVGYTIERIIKSHGFKPVSNLTGHEISRGNLHAGLIIPNIRPNRLFSRKKIAKGMIIAIEPFSTNGKAGSVRSGTGKPRIYSSAAPPKTEVGKIIVKRYNRVPFSLRDAHILLKNKGHQFDGDKLGKYLSSDHFRSYPPLIEATGGIVAQAEHTVYVTRKGTKQIT